MRKQTVVYTFGRMNPPSAGHERLVKFVSQLAQKHDADAAVYLSRSNDLSRNPISYNQKLKMARKAFGSIVKITPVAANNPVAIGELLVKQYPHVILAVGDDRATELQDKSWTTKLGIQVVALPRNQLPSATQLRDFAKHGALRKLRAGLASRLRPDAESISRLIIHEANEHDASIQQRLQQRVRDLFFRNRIVFGHARELRRHASQSEIHRRAKKLALRYLRNKVLGGGNYYKLPLGARQDIDNYVLQNKGALGMLASKFYNVVASSESQRGSNHAYRENMNKQGTFRAAHKRGNESKSSRNSSRTGKPHLHIDPQTGARSWT